LESLVQNGKFSWLFPQGRQNSDKARAWRQGVPLHCVEGSSVEIKNSHHKSESIIKSFFYFIFLGNKNGIFTGKINIEKPGLKT